MKTAAETAQHLQEVITNIYLHPAMYGQTVADVEQALWIYHGMWAFVTERETECSQAQADACTAADCGVQTFDHAYRKSHAGAPDHEVLDLVLKFWAMVTTRMGIPLPAKYPDPEHCFLPTMPKAPGDP